jgi:SAM-dependent methyltransferase
MTITTAIAASMHGVSVTGTGQPILCPICHGPSSLWISCPIDPKTGHRTFYGSAFICSACDVAAIYPLPSKTVIPQFYQLEKYYTHGESHFQEVNTTIIDRVLVKLAWLLDHGSEISADGIIEKFTQPGRACDLGCGSAMLLHQLYSVGWQVVGVEPDPKARLAASKKGIDVYDGTAEELPNEIVEKRYDLVILRHTLEHCLEPVTALNNAATLLRPGGYLLLEVPNKDCIHFRTFGGSSECYDAPRHLFFFGPAGLRKLVESQGLMVVHEYQHGFTRHHLPIWRATERRICRQIRAAGGNAVDHTWINSIILLLREMISSNSQRYDAVGLWATRR